MPERSPHRSRGRAAAVALGALSALAGCGHTQTCEFDDRPRDDVWMAVVQASRAPRYPGWIVIDNKVKVDDASHRVTVWRDVRRDVIDSGLSPRREERQWRFMAEVVDGPPVSVRFSTPDWSVPGHFWEEADHFMAQVRMRLGEMGPVTPPPGDPLGGAAPAARDPEAPGATPPVPAAGGLAAP